MQNRDDKGFDSVKKVNRPQLTTGMTRIMFNENGKTILDGQDGWSEDNWYNYGTNDANTETGTDSDKNWANTQTKEGSMWVWIPRFAYKLDKTNKAIDVKFLIGTSDNYYDDEGQIKTAQRQKTVGQIINTEADYTVHPAFTNETSIGYANGGWKEELRGFWISKFEGGLPDESTAPKTSYGSDLYYPVFQGLKASYNYINVSQSYLLARSVAESGNPYGITNANSHLIKNSEWGAVAYLSYSQYGKTGKNTKDVTIDSTKEVYVNNVNIGGAKNSVRGKPIYSVTGYSAEGPSTGSNKLTDTKLKDKVTGSAGKSYAWYTEKGKNASSTGTIYGVFDLSGGMIEHTSGYVKNEGLSNDLKSNGYAFVYTDSEKTTYVGNTPNVTEYPSYESGKLIEVLQPTGRYGDALVETLGWFNDWTDNNASGPFPVRGRLL